MSIDRAIRVIRERSRPGPTRVRRRRRTRRGPRVHGPSRPRPTREARGPERREPSARRHPDASSRLSERRGPREMRSDARWGGETRQTHVAQLLSVADTNHLYGVYRAVYCRVELCTSSLCRALRNNGRSGGEWVHQGRTRAGPRRPFELVEASAHGVAHGVAQLRRQVACRSLEGPELSPGARAPLQRQWAQ